MTSLDASAKTITITLKLFAVYQETVGEAEQVLTLPVGTTVGEVYGCLISQHPRLAQWKEVTRFGINLQFVEADTVLKENDELVFIPPVSGG